MRSVALSLLLCTFCIHQGYALRELINIPHPKFDDFTNHQACLAEQKLDLSVFGISDWKEYSEDSSFFRLREHLDENKRNTLLACLLHHKPMYSFLPIIIKTKDGKYEINAERGDADPSFLKKCKVHEHDLIKFVGCYYEANYEPMRDPANLNH